jgi:excisionase family DNA binding protein
VREAAVRLQVTRQHIVRLIEEGLLPAFNVSSKPRARKAWRIPVRALLAFIQKRSSLG